MEKRKDFKRVVEDINQLMQQLLSIGEDAQIYERQGVEAEEELERYFARAEQALAARKDRLLRELAHKLIAQSMSSFFLFLFSPTHPLYKRRWWLMQKRT